MRWLAPLAVLALGLARGLALPGQPFVDWTHDEVYFLPLAAALRNPDLFATDALFQEFRGAFPVPYLALVDAATRACGSQEAMLRWVPAALIAVQLLGMYALAARVTGSRVGGLAVALVASHPWPTPFLVGFGILPGRLYPRDVTTALLPWLLLMRASGSRRIPYFIAGLLASIHPVSAPQIALLLLAWGLAVRGREETGRGPLAREAAMGGLLCVAGAAPYLVALARVQDLSLPPLDLVRFRMPYALPPPALDAVRFVLVQAFFPALIGGIGLAAGRLVPGARRALLATLAASIGIALLGGLTDRIPSLLPFEPVRAAQYVYLPLLVGVGALVARAAAARRAGPIAASAIAVILMIDPSRPIGALGGIAARAGLAESRTSFFLQTDPQTLRSVLEASAIDPGDGREAFLDLARFAREETDASDLFLLPPAGLDHFRVHALRGLFVTWKDGGVLLFSGHYARHWNERFRRSVAAYASHDPRAFGQFLSSGEAQFVVCDARRSRLQFPVAHENSRFVVYGPGARHSSPISR